MSREINPIIGSPSSTSGVFASETSQRAITPFSEEGMSITAISQLLLKIIETHLETFEKLTELRGSQKMEITRKTKDNTKKRADLYKDVWKYSIFGLIGTVGMGVSASFLGKEHELLREFLQGTAKSFYGDAVSSSRAYFLESARTQKDGEYDLQRTQREEMIQGGDSAKQALDQLLNTEQQVARSEEGLVSQIG